MKKKILILANSSSGLYGFRRELLLKLTELGYEVHISVPEGDCMQALQDMGCIYIPTSIDRRGMNPLRDGKLLCFYARILKRLKPEAVLTYTIKPNIYGGIICRTKKIPYIVNITGLGTALETEGMVQKVLIILYRLALKRARCICFQNTANRQFFKEKHIKGNKEILLPGSGVSLSRFIYRELPPGECVKFLFFGRIMKEKGIEQFIETAEFIKKKYPQTEFKIVGYCDEDGYEERLKKLQAEGILIWHDAVEDIRPFLESSHCIIHPSYYPEGMSNVCLESAATGRAVITTKRHGCAETVSDKETGFLAEEKNTAEFIGAVEAYLAMTHEERVLMGKKAREKMEQEFDRTNVVHAYIKLLEEL